jgi:uroporphyrinogen decarboxylase
MSKELLINALRGEDVERSPWVPFAGVHAGYIKGYTAEDVLKDGDKLFESLMEVYKLYTPDGMPVIFDLQVEAEILGCELQWSNESPPSVKNHPLKENKQIPCKCKIPSKEDGRIPLIIDVMKKIKKEIGDDTALYGLICGPLTLASHLRGSGIFMDMIKEVDYIKDLMEFCADVSLAMAEYYIDAGMDVIAVVDPIVSQISPRHFKSLFSDAFTAVFDYVRSRGAYSSFFVCGNAIRQLDVMCKTNPDSISIDENVDIRAAKEVTDKYGIVIGGNIPLTTTMLFGTQQDNMKYVVDMIDSIDGNNFIVAPGCDMPYDVPVENVIAVTQAALNTDQVREMIKNYETTDFDMEIDLPEYDGLSRPFVEVFTLDSLNCAACTYMMNSALVAEENYGDKIDVVEYKYNVKENIARCKKMGVRQLPSMYINGELKWSSIIPNRDELFEEIDKYL